MAIRLSRPVAGSAIGLVQGLWAGAELPAGALERLALVERGLILPSVFRVDRLALAAVAASALAAAELWRLRGGRAQRVRVDGRVAQLAFRSERYLRIESLPERPVSPIWGYYQTADGRWIQLHTNFPHHEAGVCRLLETPVERDAVARAVSGWPAFRLESALAERGLCGVVMRERGEWVAQAPGAALGEAPLLELECIGDAPPAPLPRSARPLGGVRALDLTRVIAGPVAGRTLAEHGAEVLRVHAPHLPGFPALDTETGRGKRSTFLDLRRPDDRRRMLALTDDADVLVQGYRPGAIAGHGLGPEQVAARRTGPGIVYVSLSAFGSRGPWAARRGFDSLVQMASGIAARGAAAAGVEEPRPLPCQALDHATGYLAAFGAMLGLYRRMTVGGSWHVRLSLAQTAEWLWDLGAVDGLAIPDPTWDDVQDVIESTGSELGRVRAVRPVAELSETPGRWTRPPTRLGAHPPAWVGDAS